MSDLNIKVYGNGLLVSGDTYTYRRRLKQLGGKWNKTLKGWIFPRSSEKELSKISNIDILEKTEDNIKEDIKEDLLNDLDISIKKDRNFYVIKGKDVYKISNELRNIDGVRDFKLNGWRVPFNRDKDLNKIATKYNINIDDNISINDITKNIQNLYIGKILPENKIDITEIIDDVTLFRTPSLTLSKISDTNLLLTGNDIFRIKIYLDQFYPVYNRNYKGYIVNSVYEQDLLNFLEYKLPNITTKKIVKQPISKNLISDDKQHILIDNTTIPPHIFERETPLYIDVKNNKLYITGDLKQLGNIFKNIGGIWNMSSFSWTFPMIYINSLRNFITKINSISYKDNKIYNEDDFVIDNDDIVFNKDNKDDLDNDDLDNDEYLDNDDNKDVSLIDDDICCDELSLDRKLIAIDKWYKIIRNTILKKLPEDVMIITPHKFKKLNYVDFEGKFPITYTSIKGSRAGAFSWPVGDLDFNKGFKYRIHLSLSVLKTEEHIKQTLGHELAHAARILIEKTQKVPRERTHGNKFLHWANIIMGALPTIVITPYHNYEITRYKYSCTSCLRRFSYVRKRTKCLICPQGLLKLNSGV